MRHFTTIILLSLQLIIFAQIPAGYYNAAEGKTGAALKSQLSAIISANYTDIGYDGLYNVYKTSDNLPNGKVWDMYSLKSNGTANYYFNHDSDKCGSYSAEGNCYNREHTFCDSWLGEASPQRSDAHHLIPTDGYVNNRRSSFPHGKVGSASWTSSNGSKVGSSDASTGYSGTVFEPIDEFKGDFARMYFYVATRYESKIAGWVNNGSANSILDGTAYPAYKSWFYNLMLQWNALDPVSTKEINRNNAVYGFQHNRNPFIDYPNLAEYIWGNLKGQSWTTNSTSVSYLTSPSNASSHDIGKVAYNTTDTMGIYVKAVNLTGDLSVVISGTYASRFSTPNNTISKTNAESGTRIIITYSATTLGVQTATLTISGGGINSTSVTLKGESTDSFMALDASNISSNSFTANWLSSANATSYLLNVYSYTGSTSAVSQTLLEEDFAAGLPSTWSSSGYIDNSLTSNIKMSSGSQAGSITTPVVNMSSPTTLLVRAKQYGSDTGAKLTALVNNEEVAVWTTATENQDFSVNIPAKTTTSKVSLNSASGSGNRVYVDYVKISTQGIALTPVSVNGFPVTLGIVTNFVVTGLESDSVYYYTVTPQGNTAGKSNEIQVQTSTVSGITSFDVKSLSWKIVDGNLVINDLPEKCSISLYDLMGKQLIGSQISAQNIQFNQLKKGIYILKIKTLENEYFQKFMINK